MNIKFLSIIFIFLLFPTLSFLNIGNFPLLRVDFVGQILLLGYMILKVSTNNIKMKKVELLLFSLLIFMYSYSSLLNIFYFDSFNGFNFFKMFIQSSFVFLICLFLLNLDLKTFDLMRFYKYLFNFGFILAIYSLYQAISLNIIELPFESIHFNNPKFHEYSIQASFAGYTRPTSVFMEPTHFAFFLQVIIIVGLFSLKYNYQKIVGVNFVKLSVVIIAFLSTISLFNFLSLLVVTFIYFKFVRILIFTLIPLIGVSLYSLDLLGPFIRIVDLLYILFISGDLSIIDSSFMMRLGKIIIGLQVWMDHFWIGTGLNNIEAFSSEYNVSGNWFRYDTDFVFTNVFYIQALAETGILGTIILTLFFVYMFKQLKYLNINSIEIKFYAQISIALLIGFLVNQDLPFSSSYRLIYFILIFIAINKVKEYRRSKIEQ